MCGARLVVLCTLSALRSVRCTRAHYVTAMHHTLASQYQHLPEIIVEIVNLIEVISGVICAERANPSDMGD